MVWLGEVNNGTERALRSIHIVMEQCRNETNNYRDFKNEVYNPVSEGGFLVAHSRAPFPSACDWDALGMSTPWLNSIDGLHVPNCGGSPTSEAHLVLACPTSRQALARATPLKAKTMSDAQELSSF